MTKQKLVRPQMTVEARDILKSWDGESYSDKVKAMDTRNNNALACSVLADAVGGGEKRTLGIKNELLSAKVLELNDIISNFKMNQKHLESEIKTKTKELSTLAGYLAISICVNFVAIGWVAWTKGWLS